MAGVLMTQLRRYSHLDILNDFRTLAYQAVIGR
jgi:hypothetical protein